LPLLSGDFPWLWRNFLVPFGPICQHFLLITELLEFHL
jgi:hypothetical protein